MKIEPKFATGGVVPEGAEPFIPEGGCDYIVRTPEHQERVRNILRQINEQDAP